MFRGQVTTSFEIFSSPLFPFSGACVAIHEGADPRVLRNRIHDSEQGAVWVYWRAERALLSLVNAEI
jgi:hypothetical protein